MSELTGGIKNAIDRGQSPEQARQSFLNAGYNEQEIDEALNQLNPALFTQIQTPKELQTPTTNNQIDNAENLPHLKKLPTTPAPKRKSKKILWAIFILLIILIISATAFVWYFWDKPIF